MKAYLELAETEKLENAATCMRDKVLVRILARLGCRISEALALEVKDIDFDRGTATIKHSKSPMRLVCPDCHARLGRTHAFCPRCGVKVQEALAEQRQLQRMRTVPLDSDTLRMLKDYIEGGGSVRQNDKLLIFGINRYRAWQIITECAKRAGLGKLANPERGRLHNVSPHRLRDAFAVHAVKVDDSGDGFRLLQEHLGHMSFNTTAKYRKVAGHELREWYDRLWEKRAEPREG